MPDEFDSILAQATAAPPAAPPAAPDAPPDLAAGNFGRIMAAAGGEDFDPQGFEHQRRAADAYEYGGQARERAERVRDSSGRLVVRHSLPFLSAGVGYLLHRDYGEARAAVGAGRGTRRDYQTVADFERSGQIERERPAWQTALAGAPAVIGETLATGGMGGAAAEGASLFSRAGLAAAGRSALRPGTYGSLLARTAVTPSLYLEDWARRNVEAGRDAADPRGLPPALAHGMLTNAVLGSVGRGAAGEGPVAAARRVLSGSARGIGGQQVADVLGSGLSEVLPEAYKLQTGYGRVGDILQGARTGNWEPALQHSLADFVGFLAFGAAHEAMHGGPPTEGQAGARMIEQLRGTVEALHARGESQGGAAEVMRDLVTAARAHLDHHPGMTPEAALDLALRGTPSSPAYSREAPPPSDLTGEARTGAPPADLVNPLNNPANPPQPPAPQGEVQGPPRPPPVPPERVAQLREILTGLGEKGVARMSPEQVVALARESGADRFAPEAPLTPSAEPIPSPQPQAPQQAPGSLAPEPEPSPAGQPRAPTRTPQEQAVWERIHRSKDFPDVGNRLAFDAAGPSGAVAVTDLDRAGAMGRERAGAALRGKIEALRAAGAEPYHIGSDEFLARGASAEDLGARLEDARRRLRGTHGADFSYGVGATPAEAERAMARRKQDRGPRPVTEVSRTHLLDRLDRGEGDLSPAERQILRERLLWATSFRDLGESLGVSGARVQQLERAALGKLGHTGSVDELHLAGRGGQAVAEVENGRHVGADELREADPHGAGHNARVNQIAAAADQLNALQAKQQKEEQGGGLSPTAERRYRAEFERLRRVIDQGHGEAAPPPGQPGGALPERAGGEPAPVQRPGGGEPVPPGPEVPGAAAAGAGSPPAERAPEAQGPAQAAPAGGGGGAGAAALAGGAQAAGDVVERRRRGRVEYSADGGKTWAVSRETALMNAPAAPAGPEAPGDVLELARAVRGRGGEGGLADLVHLRQDLGWPRDRFDRAAFEARKAGLLSGEVREGRHGITAQEQAADIQDDPGDRRTRIGYLTLREEGRGATADQPGPPARNQRQAWEAEARHLGVEPKDLHDLAAQIREHDRAANEEHNAVLREARSALGEFGGAAKMIHLDRYQDPGHVRGLDEVADAALRRHPHLFDPEREKATDTLFRLLKEGNKKPMPRERAYDQALAHLHELSRRAHATPEETADVHAAAEGVPPAQVRADVAAIESEALREAAGHASEDYFQAQTPQRSLFNEPELTGGKWLGGLAPEPAAEPLYRPGEAAEHGATDPGDFPFGANEPGGGGFGQPLSEQERERGTFGGGQPEASGAASPARRLEETALANAVTQAERATRLETPLEAAARQDNPETWARGGQMLARDKDAGKNLAEELARGPRPVSPEEGALLLRWKIALGNEYQRVGTALVANNRGRLPMDAVERAALERQQDALHEQLDRLDRAVHATGTQLGRSLQFRRQLAAEDFSLGGMLMRAELAKGKPLTPAETERVQEQQRRIAETGQAAEAAEEPVGALATAGPPGESAAEAGRRVATSEEFRTLQTRKGAAEGEREDFRRDLAAWQRGRLPWADRWLDWLTRLRRAFVLSGPQVIEKLVSAGQQQMLLTPLQDMIGSAIRRIPGLSRITALAPREGGGFSPTAEGRAWAAAYTDGMRDAWQTLRTGKSELELLHGHGEARPRDWIDLVGELHAALKAPVKRGEFTRSLLRRVEQGAARGHDVTSPAALGELSAQAYMDANRAIFMEDNAVATAWNRATAALTRPEASPGAKGVGYLMKAALPVVRVPTNIVAQTLEYTFGLATGSARAGLALRRGVETLKPAEADVIARQLKRGSLGAAVLALGYAAPGVVGGFYSGRRDPEDVEAGAIGGVPRLLLHHPLLEALQVGATVRRASRPGRRRLGGTDEGVAAAMAGLLGEVPHAREAREITRMVSTDPRERGRAFGELLKSLAVPQLFQWAAGRLDTTTGTLTGPAVRRSPRTLLQHVETGVPGLRASVPAAAR